MSAAKCAGGIDYPDLASLIAVSLISAQSSV